MRLKRSLAIALLQHRGVTRGIKKIARSKWFTNLPLYKRVSLGRARRKDEQFKAGGIKPWLLIETVLTCNARCLMCVHSQRDMRGEMSEELFEKVVREASEWGIERVTLGIYGETFADRNLLRRIETIRAHGLSYDLVTNGSLMTAQTLTRMLDLGGWNDVMFSVNGFSKESYEAMMPPLKRDTVYGAIKMFTDLLVQRKLDKPTIRISCIVSRLNQHERHRFTSYWRGQPGVTQVLWADAGTWNGELENTEVVFDGKRQHVSEAAWLAPCPSPWGHISVLYDGKVIPCCEEAAGRRLIVGDANKSTLQEIFHGPAMERLRKTHLENRRCEHKVCSKCKRNQSWL